MYETHNFFNFIHFFAMQSENFRNRHGYFSLNVQTICDAQMRVMNVVARWPGSAHDSNIFAHSEVRQQFERGEFFDYVIVGEQTKRAHTKRTKTKY